MVVTEADPAGWTGGWTVDDVRPYIEHALEVFGDYRVAYGGDWPVVLNASPYRRWVETLEAITAGLSPSRSASCGRTTPGASTASPAQPR